MTIINICGADAAIRKHETLTVGRVGAKIEFQFDESWYGLAKTAVFVSGNITKDVPNIDTIVEIPHEVLQFEGLPVAVGVYGINGNGTTIIPTIWVLTRTVKAGADPSGDESVADNLDMWKQMSAKIGDISELSSDDKDSLVAAINEAIAKANEVKQKANNGAFNGTPGTDGASFEVFSDLDMLKNYPTTTTATEVRFIWAGEDKTEYSNNILGSVVLNKHGIYDAVIVIKEAGHKYFENITEVIVLSGDVDEENIKAIVENYLEENPIEGGMTEEQAQQLEQNTTDIADLKNNKADKKDIPAAAADVGAEPEGAVSEHNNSTNAHSDLRREVASAKNSLSVHNNSENAHNDIRLRVAEYIAVVEALLNSDDETLNETKEIVEYIKSNRALIEAITTNKVNVADIVNNLTTNVANKPLSAAQGKVLKGLIDAISVPTKLSELSGDSTHRTVTDAEKSAWNGKSDFSGSYNDLTNKPTIPTVPTKLSSFTDDVGYLKNAVLNSAVNTALAQAKASGEFDGTSPTVSVSDITGGHKISITDINGTKTVNVMDGAKGGTGRGISKVERTSGTGTAGTTDTYTITYTDSTTSTFTVYNGKNGTNGKDGEDYILTEDDKNEIAEISMQNEKGNIVNQIITELQGLPVFGVVDENKTITVTSQLTDGTYTLKYENADGTTTDIGTIIIGTGGGSGSEPVITGISANYTGGNVAEGTAVSALTGITVTVTYSDGSTQTVTDYTLSEGTINAGSNTITVTYEGFTTTFIVTGVAPSYVNLVPTAKAFDNRANVFNNVGYMNGKYVSSSSPYYGDNSGTFVTGLIESEKNSVFYIKGVTIDTTNGRNRLGVFCNEDDSNLSGKLNCNGAAEIAGDKMKNFATLETLGTQYYKLTMNATYISANFARFKYIAISAMGDGANCIISKTPIE